MKAQRQPSSLQKPSGLQKSNQNVSKATPAKPTKRVARSGSVENLESKNAFLNAEISSATIYSQNSEAKGGERVQVAVRVRPL